MKNVFINSEYIKLVSFLKFAGAFESGAAAGIAVTSGKVSLNGEECLIKGKKLFGGEKVSVGKEEFKVVKK